MKRIIDLTTAAVGLVLLSPILVAIAIAIKWYDGGPVFYKASRIGKGGQLFQLYKYRSMVINAAQFGPGITATGDARITPLGRFLRRTKLDEVPQLINVLKGEMCLVGPRPEDPRYVALYSPEQRRILSVAPGITSAASLIYRHEETLLGGTDWESVYRNKVLPEKIAIDLDYLAQRNLRSDIGLIIKTVLSMKD